MPRINRTRYTLLALLSLEPMSGYDMRQFIERSISHFWHESFGQIYPTLRSLREDGLIEEELRDGNGHPRRKVYRLTPRGREELRRWLSQPAEPPVLRNELLLKLFFGPEIPTERSIEQLEAYRDHQAATLEYLRSSLESLEAYRESPYYPYWKSIGEGGVAVTETRIRWCKETLARLRE